MEAEELPGSAVLLQDVSAGAGEAAVSGGPGTPLGAPGCSHALGRELGSGLLVVRPCLALLALRLVARPHARMRAHIRVLMATLFGAGSVCPSLSRGPLPRLGLSSGPSKRPPWPPRVPRTQAGRGARLSSGLPRAPSRRRSLVQPAASLPQARINARLQQYRAKAELARSTRPQAWVPREKLPRPLTSSASAIRKLMRKAELMGISTDIFPVDTSDTSSSVDGRRKHKQPALTADFVNYYFERNMRMIQIQENSYWQCSECDQAGSSDMEADIAMETLPDGTKRSRRQIKEPVKFVPQDMPPEPKKMPIRNTRTRGRKRSFVPEEEKPEERVPRERRQRQSVLQKKPKSEDLRTECATCKGTGDNENLVRVKNCVHLL
uniref:Uncharacterized protein n=1 Tax=Monodelphis domestica TaxID=13616 RepID=F6Y4T1_MONDO